MRNRLLISLLSIAILTGCSHSHDHGSEHHDHDHADMHDAGHSHDHDGDHDEDVHEHAAGVIHFSEEQAAAAGLLTEVVQPAPFTQVLKVNG